MKIPNPLKTSLLSCIPASPASAMEYNADLNYAKGILDSNVATT